MRKSLGFNWGAAGLSTALFTGVYLCDVLDYVGVQKGAKHVIFEGADKLPNGPYGTSQKLPWARDRTKGMMLSWAMNGLPLEYVTLALSTAGADGAPQTGPRFSAAGRHPRSDWREERQVVEEGRGVHARVAAPSPLLGMSVASAAGRRPTRATGQQGFADSGDAGRGAKRASLVRRFHIRERQPLTSAKGGTIPSTSSTTSTPTRPSPAPTMTSVWT